MMTMMTMIIVRDYGNGYGDSDDVYHYDVRDCVDILGQTCRPRRIVKVKVALPLKPRIIQFVMI